MSEESKNQPEESTNPRDLGEVSQQLRDLAARHQAESRNITMQIGALEVRKAQMLGLLDRMNTDLQRLINAEARRIGIPDGVQWQIDENGHAIAVGDMKSRKSE